MALVGALAAAALVPATGTAATPTVTGDDGVPVAIAPGLAIRNLSAQVAFALAPGEGFVTSSVVGPDGVAAAFPRDCSSSTAARSVDYRGNGLYTVAFQVFPEGDFSCETPLGPPVAAQYAVNGSIALSGPRGRVLFRPRNGFGTRPIRVNVAQNPGALTTEVRYARAGRIGPDGGIMGASQTGFVDRTTGIASLRLPRPGTWVVVARARGLSGGGEFFTPWSAPLRIRAIAPFDLERVTFPDARGPSYQLRGQTRERSTRGVMRISIARGARGGSFRSLGTARVRANGVFVKRFTERRGPGAYRLRYRFTATGAKLTAGGTVTQRVTITRRVFFR